MCTCAESMQYIIVGHYNQQLYVHKVFPTQRLLSIVIFNLLVQHKSAQAGLPFLQAINIPIHIFIWSIPNEQLA